MGHVVSVLTDDLISKQTALDKLQRAVLRAEGSSQLGQWQVQEAEKRSSMLAADLAQLRKLLHEEKFSSKVNSLLNAVGIWPTPSIPGVGWGENPSSELTELLCCWRNFEEDPPPVCWAQLQGEKPLCEASARGQHLQKRLMLFFLCKPDCALLPKTVQV